MIYEKGSGMSCSCDLCGATEHGITIPCSSGMNWEYDGYDERDCEDAEEVCAMLYDAGWRASKSAQFCPDCCHKHPDGELDELEVSIWRGE